MIYRVFIRPRLLQFKQPAGTSRGVYTYRKVWYVLVVSLLCPGARGVGECAPLPDLSIDALPNDEYEKILRRFCDEFQRTGELPMDELKFYPSMRFGLEVAKLSVEASIKGHPGLLFDNDFTRLNMSIPINGLVWMGNFEEMLGRMNEKLKQGFACVKLKVGALNFEDELELLRLLRKRYSANDVELRVDANGAFSPSDAYEKIGRLEQFQLHSIEQPIAAGQWKDLASLCQKSPLPIALDEELIPLVNRSDKVKLLEMVSPHYLVLKPSLHGGLLGAQEWMDEADARNIPYWVTSALESNVGLNALAQWVGQWWNERGKPEVRHQGLGTGALYTSNVEEQALSLEGERLWWKSSAHRKFHEELKLFKKEFDDETTSSIKVLTSGSTGIPKIIHLNKKSIKQSALRTLKHFGLTAGQTALLCLPFNRIAGKMMAVRAWLGDLKLLLVPPTSTPFANLSEAPCFAALTPMQVFETLKHPRQKKLLKNVKHLLIGGGAIPESLEKQLTDFPNAVWCSFGMTETCSHVALRRVNGVDRTEYYIPLPNVEFSISTDGRIVVFDKLTTNVPLITNDLGIVNPDGTFVVKGRVDNVVCSGGIKLQIELIEEKLHSLQFPIQLTSLPDEKYGEALTLLYVSELAETKVESLCRKVLTGPEVPKHYIRVNALPITDNGKPARKIARDLALKLSQDLSLI